MEILEKIDEQLGTTRKGLEETEEGELLRELIYRALEVTSIVLEGTSGLLDISRPSMKIFIDDSNHQPVREIDVIEKGIRGVIRATVENRIARDILREAIEYPEKVKITIKEEG